MKLHLPKLLLVAVLSAVTLTAQAVEIDFFADTTHFSKDGDNYTMLENWTWTNSGNNNGNAAALDLAGHTFSVTANGAGNINIKIDSLTGDSASKLEKIRTHAGTGNTHSLWIGDAADYQGVIHTKGYYGDGGYFLFGVGTTTKETAVDLHQATLNVENSIFATSSNAVSVGSLTLSGSDVRYTAGSQPANLGTKNAVPADGTGFTNAGTASDGAVISAATLNMTNTKVGQYITMKVTGTGTANNVTLGTGAKFDLAENATLNVTGLASAVVQEGNAFGTISYDSANVTKAETATLKLNNIVATLSGDVYTASSTDYYINDASATWSLTGATTATVNTHTTETPVALGGARYTLNTLTVESGKVTTTRDAGDGCISGDIVVKGGAVFEVAGGHDAFGYNDNVSTRSITLTGTSVDAMATLALNQTTSNTVTMKTNLILNGNAQVTGKGFNTFGGNITVSGTNNTISRLDQRNDATITVNNGAELTIERITINTDTDKDRNLIKAGAGTLILKGNVETQRFKPNAGTVTLQSGTNIFRRVEAGDATGGSATVNINAAATLAVTGANCTSATVGTSYKDKGFLVSEWGNNTTWNVSGNLLSKNATMYLGDADTTLNLENGSTAAVAGIAIAEVKSGKSQGLNLNLKEGSKLVLGAAGITTTKNTALTFAAGELGLSAESTAIASDITMTGTTLNTAQYTFNEAGTALSAGTATGTIALNGAVTGSALTVNGGGKLLLGGTATLTDGLTLNGGSTIEVGTNGTLTLSGAVTVVNTNVSRKENIPTSGNGFSTITYSQAILSGSANPEGVTGWTLNGNAATFSSGTVSYNVNSGNYYVVETESTGLTETADILNLHTTAAISNSTFTVNDYADVAANTTLTFTDTTVNANKVWLHNGSDVKLEGTSALTVDGMTIAGGEITVEGNNAAVLGDNGNPDFHKAVVLTGSDITVTGSTVRTYTVRGGSVTIGTAETQVTTAMNSTLSDTTAVTVNEGSTAQFNNAGSAAASLSGKGSVIVAANADLTVTGDANIGALSGAGALNVGGNLTVNGDVSLGGMTLNGGTVTLGTAESHDHTLALKDLTVTGEGSVINANLAISGGTLTMGNSVELGCSITLSNEELVLTNANITGEALDITTVFTDVESLTLGTTTYAYAEMGWYNAAEALTSLTFGETTITGEGLNNYVIGYWNGTVSIADKALPEPATATMSLLALAALAARRKRK